MTGPRLRIAASPVVYDNNHIQCLPESGTCMTDNVIDAVPRIPPVNPILHGPILSTLIRLALPNTVSMTAATLVVIFETTYIGLLGIEQLAAIALVFPFIVLMGMMSGGAMGGGVSSAIARSLGTNNDARASRLAFHAVIIGLCGGVLFMVVMEVFGRTFFSLLGGRGAVLEEAVAFAEVLFAGAIGVWLTNTLASLLRGSGNMKIPSASLLCIAAAQIIVGGTLGLGLFGFPRWGMRGVACGQLFAYTGGATFLAWFLLSGRSRVKLRFDSFRIERGMFFDILKVGAIACLSPLQSVATVLIFTKLLAPYGTVVLAGYGIGSRLEFMLVPIAAAIGLASVPIVGMNIGAGFTERARRAAWSAGGVSAAMVGSIGILLAIWPDLWAARFTDNQAVLEAARQYLTLAGPAFGFLGLALSLYFASQGSGKILGPVLAQSGRLVTVAAGGWILLTVAAPAWTLFSLAAASMVVYGILAAMSVWFVHWGPARTIPKTH